MYWGLYCYLLFMCCDLRPGATPASSVPSKLNRSICLQYPRAPVVQHPCCMHLSLLCMYWQCLQQHSSLLAAPAITLHSNPMPFLEGPMPTPPTAAPMTTLLPTSCCEPNPTLDPTWTCSLTQTPSPTPTSSPTKTPTINTGPITDVKQFWDFECQAKV